MAKCLKQSRGGRKTAKIELPADEESKIVVQWFKQHHGWPLAEIQRVTGLEYQFVRRWANRDDTKQVVSPGKRKGPAPVIAGAELDALVDRVKKKRFSSSYKEQASFINPRTKKVPSATTVQRALHRAGLTSIRVRRTCFLTAAHRETRVWFANLNKRTNWRDWVFSDEKWFMIGGIKGNEKMWVEMCDPDPEERYVGKVAHPTKVMVWGAIAYNGRSNLHFFDGKVKGEQYCEAVKDAMIDYLHEPEWMNVRRGAKMTFMQDGARCHTSKSTEAWLEEQLPASWSFTPLGGWPANSPDLNPIEVIWAVLQDKVIEREAFTEEKLAQVIEEEWWNLDQQIIKDLYDKQKDKMKLVIKHNGGRIPKVGQ